MVVVEEVGAEEEGGGGEGRQHAGLMALDVASFDEAPAAQQERRAGGVESGVDRGEIGERQTGFLLRPCSSIVFSARARSSSEISQSGLPFSCSWRRRIRSWSMKGVTFPDWYSCSFSP